MVKDQKNQKTGNSKVTGKIKKTSKATGNSKVTGKTTKMKKKKNHIMVNTIKVEKLQNIMKKKKKNQDSVFSIK